MIKFFRKIRQKLLTENRFSKYMLYAIGEIILVVIGILIALQINNKNDLRKKERLRQAYTKSLISNLEKDSINLNRFLEYSEKLYNKVLNHNRKIQSSTITMDSLLFFARYEFEQTTPVFSISFNNQTFKTLVSSGNIELYDKEISNDLMQLNSLHEQFNLGVEKHNDNYIRQLSKYGESYPLRMEILKAESPVQKLIWNSINKREFSSLFISVVAFKAVLEHYGRSYISEILKSTTQLLEKLKKAT